MINSGLFLNRNKKIFHLLRQILDKNMLTDFSDPFCLRFFVGYGLELSRIVPLIIYHLKRKFVCKNEAELKAAWAPGDLSYGTRVPGDMLIVTIVLCYSVIAPLIIPFGVLYFGLGWLILRNQVKFLKFCFMNQFQAFLVGNHR